MPYYNYLVGDHTALVIKHCFFIDLSNLTVNITKHPFLEVYHTTVIPLKKKVKWWFKSLYYLNHFLFPFHNTRIPIMIKLTAHKGEPGLIMTYELLSKLNFHFFNHHNTRNTWKYIKTNRDQRKAEGKFLETEITYRLNSTWSTGIIVCSNGPGTRGTRRLDNTHSLCRAIQLCAVALNPAERWRGSLQQSLGVFFKHWEV